MEVETLVWSAAVTRIPAAVEAIHLITVPGKHTWCTGTLQDLQQDGTVVTSFAMRDSNSMPGGAICGFNAKVLVSVLKGLVLVMQVLQNCWNTISLRPCLMEDAIPAVQ